MLNTTEFTIILTAYFNVGWTNYIYFLMLLLFYLTIIVSNVLLIGVIYVEQSLHKPMYIFLCFLCANELYGSTAIFPFIMSNLLLENKKVTIGHCYFQIFLLYTYASVEFGSLVIMSYDRYTAICHPLLYNSKMTRNRVTALIALVWLVSFLKFTINIFLSLQLQLCGNTIEKVYCDNYLLIKLACSDTTLQNIYGIVGSIVSIGFPFILIVYSYMKILQVCLKSSAEVTQKAIRTCAPHIVSLLNFSVGCSFEIFSSRFDKIYMPPVIRVIISVYFVMSPPLVNPLMYGMRLSEIKRSFKKHFIAVKWKR